MDLPDGIIKLHKVPTPYLGGVAVFFGTLLPSLLVMPFTKESLLLILALSILMAVGLIDDLRILKPHQKFLGQLSAVIIFVSAGFYIHPTMCTQFVAMCLSGFLMLTVINAFNLVDVMDGLACVLALCAAIGFLVVSLYLQHVLLALIFVIFIGSLVGFLYYNRPQAKIYLGDAGSLFLGGMLAALPCGLSLGKYTNLGYFAPLFMLAIPLLELVSLSVVRTLKGIPFYKGSPDHFSMYLQSYGWGKLSILIYSAFFMIIANAIGLLLILDLMSLQMSVLISVFFLAFWVYVLLHKPSNSDI